MPTKKIKIRDATNHRGAFDRVVSVEFGTLNGAFVRRVRGPALDHERELLVRTQRRAAPGSRGTDRDRAMAAARVWCEALIDKASDEQRESVRQVDITYIGRLSPCRRGLHAVGIDIG